MTMDIVTRNLYEKEEEKGPRGVGDLIKEKAFLGHEFLTWLWWRSETRGGVFSSPVFGEVQVGFVRFVTVEGGTDDARETITCRGIRARLREALHGLSLGKKVSRARILLDTGDVAYEVTLRGDTLDCQSFKVVRGMGHGDDREEGYEDKEGLLLDMFSMLRTFLDILQGLFLEFLEVRCDHTLWEAEKRGISRWIQGA